jgi:hypothetical protein
MAKRQGFSPKINNLPFANSGPVPLDQAINSLGQVHGLSPEAAQRAAMLQQAGVTPKAKINLGPPKIRG